MMKRILILIVLALLTLPAFGKDRIKATTKDAQLSFGIEMARRGLWSEALFRFQQAERLDPGNGRVLNNMAVAYEALGRFDIALDHYQQAIKAAPSNAEVKRNYSRFVEFYRNFKAEGGDEADADETPDSDESGS